MLTSQLGQIKKTYSDNEGYNIFFIKEPQHVRVWQMLEQKLDIQFDLSVTVFHKKKV